MSSELAELSSMGATIDEVLGRITLIAERYHAAERDDVANDLFEVERALRTAGRRIQRASKTLS